MSNCQSESKSSLSSKLSKSSLASSYGSRHSMQSIDNTTVKLADQKNRGGDITVYEKLEESVRRISLNSTPSTTTPKLKSRAASLLSDSSFNTVFEHTKPGLPTRNSICVVNEKMPRHSMSATGSKAVLQQRNRTHHSLSLPRNPVITHAIETDERMIKFNQYVLQNEIGKGSYGICQLVYNEKDNEHYAMKILSKKKLQRSLAGRHPKLRRPPGKNGQPAPKIPKTPLEKVYQEIAILKKLDHPNLVKLVEVLDDKNNDSLCMVFELMEFGEVLPMDGEGKAQMPLTEPSTRRYFVDCLLALEYLHAKGIIHRDIKPSNILLDVNRHAKIADLGVSEEATKRYVTGSAGTPAFMAPETLNTKSNNSYDGPCLDVWALGVSLYCFAFGEVPFQDEITLALYDKILTKTLNIPELGREFGISADCCDLIGRMLIRDPGERIDLDDIREHDWLKLTFDIENSELPDIWSSEEPNDLLPCKLIPKSENIGEDFSVTEQEVAKAIVTLPNISTIVRIKDQV